MLTENQNKMWNRLKYTFEEVYLALNHPGVTVEEIEAYGYTVEELEKLLLNKNGILLLIRIRNLKKETI